MKEDNNKYDNFRSAIPPHLTPEEREQWEKDMAWEKQEYERRKKEGFYRTKESDGFVSRVFRKFSSNKKDGNIGYGP